MSERKARAEHDHVLRIGNRDSAKLSHHGATTYKRLQDEKVLHLDHTPLGSISSP